MKTEQECLSKEFIEHLLELCDRVDRDKEKLYSVDDLEKWMEDT